MNGDLRGIKEKIVETALAISLISIALGISYGLIRIIHAFSSFEIGTNSFIKILYKGTNIFQFDLVFLLGIFLVISSYLPSFETHAKKLRMVGIITVLLYAFRKYSSVSSSSDVRRFP